MSVSDRAKHQAALYGRTLSLVLLVVGLVAVGSAAYVYLTPGVENVPPREADVQEFSSSVSHSAVVVNDTALYEEGQQLRNQPRYFFRATPVLRVSAVADVPDDRPVTVSHRLEVRIRAAATEQPFFERQRVLATGQETVSEGRFTLNATLNATALRLETSEIRNEIDGLGTVSTQLRLETTYETESTQGDTYEGTLTSAAPIQFADQGYWLGGNLSDSATERTTLGGGIRQQEPNMVLVGLLGVLGLVAFVLAVTVHHWSERRVDLKELKMRIDRSQYSDWISEGDFPTGHDKQYVYIESLEDLVDVAIDTNKRVIYDPEIETYAVPDGDLIYYHAVDPRSVSSWLDMP